MFPTSSNSGSHGRHTATVIMDPIEQLLRRLNLRDLRIFLAVIEQWESGPSGCQSWDFQARGLEIDCQSRAHPRRPPARPHAAARRSNEFGRAFIKRGISVFDELRQSVRELKFLADPSQGELRIGASEYMAAGLISLGHRSAFAAESWLVVQSRTD